MNATLNPTPTVVWSEWSAALTAGAREVLDQMDTTLTLSEVKAELARQLIAKRREWENDGHGSRPLSTHA